MLSTTKLGLACTPPTKEEATFRRSSSVRWWRRRPSVTVKSSSRTPRRSLLRSLMSTTTFCMFFTGSIHSSVYRFLHARKSAWLKVFTSSRSLGPVPRGKCNAQSSRQRASLLPRLLSRRMVADIHRFLAAASSKGWLISSMHCSSSSGPEGCHLAPRNGCLTSRVLRAQYLQKASAVSHSGSCLRPASSGNNSARLMTPSLSWSNSLNKSRRFSKPVISAQRTPNRPTPSANSKRLM
mmetsp:Transcript_63545/g.148207  ORF Transcript_63545/g.148207 Transcript_63545/m.148207 type:complete len:238 (+) Transcript_63545:174-887(+)